MSLVFDSDIDFMFKWGHMGQVLGDFDISGNALKVGQKIKFRFDGGNCEGGIYYDKGKFRYVIVTEPYKYVRDFSGVENIEVVGSVLEDGLFSTKKQ